MQHKDEHLESIIKTLEKDAFENYMFNNGVLYETRDDFELLFIPKQTEIIKEIHNNNGHFGEEMRRIN